MHTRAYREVGVAVETTTLETGLRIVTDSDTSVETTALGVWVGAGTRHETLEVNGISHLLEHMAFKGTAKRTAYDIAEQMDNVGGQINAYTSRDHTAYYAKVLKEDQPLALEILSDILLNSTMDAEEFARAGGGAQVTVADGQHRHAGEVDALRQRPALERAHAGAQR